MDTNLDPIPFVEVDNWGLRDLAADIIGTWFVELDVLEGALDRWRPGRRFSVTMPDHEALGSVSATMAYVRRGMHWFGHSGRFWGWSSVLQYSDRECAEIVARYEQRAEVLVGRLGALQERGL